MGYGEEEPRPVRRFFMAFSYLHSIKTEYKKRAGRFSGYRLAGLLLVAGLTVFSFSACGFDGGDETFAISYNPTVPEDEPEMSSMESSPVLEYEMPRMVPSVLVDRDGYSSNEVIYALICSGKLPEKYYVRYSDTKENAYIGTYEEAEYDPDRELYTARFVLEDFTDEGEYYIYTDELGSSYSFRISATYYQDIYWDLIGEECEKISRGETDPWETYAVLYSYERYKDVLYGIKEDAPDVLSAVGAWIAGKDIDSLSGNDGYVAVALLSKFGYNYKAVEEKLATECIRKAAALYKGFAEPSDDEEKKAAFLALSELYRTSATRSYAEEILRMSEYLTSKKEMFDSRYVLYGSMGYMTTRQSVDRAFCDKMMENLLYKCRDMNDNSKLVENDNASSADPEMLLMYAQQFAAMNYILDGYEYNEQILNIEHYLSGRNTEAYVYDIAGESTADAVAVYAWLAWLENNGKLDPSAPVKWNYSW